MAVGGGAAVAGNVLDDRQDAAREQPFAHRPAERGDGVGVVAVGAITDDFVRARDGNVEHGRAIDRDADVAKIRRY